MPDDSWTAAMDADLGDADDRRRIAVVLFNLGGPDSLDAVRPFLVNLFTDPAILRVPPFVRPFLSRLIAWLRVKPATENYKMMGGRSPLLDLTLEQAAALETALAPLNARCFVAMRYWKPFAHETAQAVKAWKPDHIVLLPLYPQFSTTTTGSSLTDWFSAARKAKLSAPTTAICCYPTDEKFVNATASILRQNIDRSHLDLATRAPDVRLRILFSAHGLPQVIVDQGDPYQFQVEHTAAAVASACGLSADDWRVCFQSRATPQKWLEPSIEEELKQAAADHVAVLVVPIAFVSEHSETLVELDIEYREVAEKLGIPGYYRVPTQTSNALFIDSLNDLVRLSKNGRGHVCSHTGNRFCPTEYTDCPMKDLAVRLAQNPARSAALASNYVSAPTPA